jgi:hypothetical protein
MPLQATSGAASYDAFGGGAAAMPQYIEDVFSTYLYTGNGATQTITNGIDLSTKGGLVWFKSRSNALEHALFDTVRGNTSILCSNITNASNPYGTPNVLTSFNSNGFSLGQDNYGWVNSDTFSQVSWTFREQPKFFDVVTYTGNSTAGRTVAHNLGSVPGCIIVKRIDGSASNWCVYHRSAGNSNALLLNTTGASASEPTFWNSTTPTESVFSLGTSPNVNYSGLNYVAYLFAHDAGGFGLTGTDNVISCGSYTGNGTTQNISLGYEPQWVLIKNSSSGARGFGSSWAIQDNMRGLFTSGAAQTLYADRTDAEDTNTVTINSTGFGVSSYNVSSDNYIYIAIRRGPMKVPTDATKVFSPVAASNSSNYVVNAGFPPDTVLATIRDFTSGYNHSFFDRLRGKSNYLASSSTNVESGVIADPTQQIADFSRNQNGIYISTGTVFAYSTLLGITYAWHNFRRAPSFFDEVCYTGTGTDDRQVTHNLGVAPELIICKSRDAAWPWWVGGSVLGSTRNGIYLNETGARQVNADAFSTNGSVFTSSYFLVSSVSAYPPNANGYKYVAYLFATCAGVSKVFSYTGNGSSQTINCGFTGGARFVMIKRTNSTGAWYVWDSARGIVSGNDPYFSMNTTAVEVTSDDSIDTNSTGFVVNQLSATDINVSSATYIGLAIA